MSDSLLPPNSTPLERDLASSLARLSDVPVLVREVWDPATCPMDVLPWLAWALSVDTWDSNWTDEQKRQTVASSIAVHRYKGTIGAVEEALAALGFGVRVQEWFNQSPAADPYTFKLLVEVDQIGIDLSGINKAIEVALAAKNLRSHMDLFDLSVVSRAEVYAASAALIGNDITIEYDGQIWPALTINVVDGDDFISASGAASVTITGTAENMNGESVTLSIDGADIGTDTVAGGAWSVGPVDLTAYADGDSHTLSVDATVAAPATREITIELLESDAAAFIARFTVAPDNTRKTAINNLFIALKTAGVYAKLDMLFVPKKGQDSQSGLLDLKRHTKAAGIVGSASWSSALGFVGVSGAGNYITSNYKPSDDATAGVTANNFGMGAYMTQHSATYPANGNPALINAYGTGALSRSLLMIDGNEVENRIQGSFIHGSANAAVESAKNSEPWFYHINRTASNALAIYRDAELKTTNTTNNAGRLLADANLHFNVASGVATTGYASAIGAVWAGEPLTESEQSDLKTALDNYFAAL